MSSSLSMKHVPCVAVTDPLGGKGECSASQVGVLGHKGALPSLNLAMLLGSWGHFKGWIKEPSPSPTGWSAVHALTGHLVSPKPLLGLEDSRAPLPLQGSAESLQGEWFFIVALVRQGSREAGMLGCLPEGPKPSQPHPRGGAGGLHKSHLQQGWAI